ncbi:hypothetical protein SLS56_011734 [Neofusicoccum ribis]|uniref:Uncharacterized protein n=1 Tax=Neofusicoccum ribis TaxID=45134 RepID=A0ABR3SAT0_9PEZI
MRHTRSLVIYFPARNNSDETLRALCVAATGAGLTRLEDDYRLARLYAGKGGEVLTGERLESLISIDYGSSPPSYDELALSPPPPAKRRRTVESSGRRPSASGSIGIPPDMEDWKVSIEAKLNAVLDRTQGLEQRQEAQGEVMKQVQKAQAATAEDVCELRTEIRRMYDTFEVRIGEVLDEVDQRVAGSTEDMRQECTDYTDLRIEERILDIKAEMREFVTEELNIQMEAVEDNLKSRARRANLAVGFSSDYSVLALPHAVFIIP